MEDASFAPPSEVKRKIKYRRKAELMFNNSSQQAQNNMTDTKQGQLSAGRLTQMVTVFRSRSTFLYLFVSFFPNSSQDALDKHCHFV